MGRADWEWLQRLFDEANFHDAGSFFTLVIAHDISSLPGRLATHCNPVIDIHQSASFKASLHAILGQYLSRKNREDIQDHVEALVSEREDTLKSSGPAPDAPTAMTDDAITLPPRRTPSQDSSPSVLPRTSSDAQQEAKSQGISPGQMRQMLDWSLLHGSDKIEEACTKMREALSSTDDDALQQRLLTDLASKYPSYGDILRFIAIATPGLMEHEIIALVKAKVTTSQMDSARFSRFRTEMLDKRIIILVGGVVDFASSGLRTAAHRSLFYDNKQRHTFLKVMARV